MAQEHQYYRALILCAITFLALTSVVDSYNRCQDQIYKFFPPSQTARCYDNYKFISGFELSDVGNGVRVITKFRCCTPQTHNDEFQLGDEYQVVNADWWASLDTYDNHWNLCPRGFFLNGMFHNYVSILGDIDMGRCVKYVSGPHHYGPGGSCYDNQVHLNPSEQVACKPDFYITGIIRRNCRTLSCLSHVRCCKMVLGPQKWNSLFDVKLNIMENTQRDIALLGFRLGFDHPYGCWAIYVGEDFRRDGNTWVAHLKEPCNEYLHKHRRLRIKYGNWKFTVTDMVYGRPVIQELKPETIDAGNIVNRAHTPVKHEFTRTENVISSVSHEATDEWKSSHEADITMSYSTDFLVSSFSAGLNYEFNYESGSSTIDTTGKEHSKTITTTESVEVPPNTAVNWTLIMSKTRRTVSYTAKVLVHFSVELEGFLRQENDYHNKMGNFHYDYRGENKSHSLNYSFGDQNVPFYESLKQQYEINDLPWMWDDIVAVRPDTSSLIKSLTNKGRYEFLLHGKFEDVEGKDINVVWGTMKNASHSNRKTVVAAGRPGDPEPVFPEPPLLKLDPVEHSNVTSELAHPSIG